MSIFEIVMLLCFGAAWPFSIYKSYESRSIEGKSFLFLTILLIGYIAGILNKLFNSYDGVIYLYIINFAMVATDMALYIRNRRFQNQHVQKRPLRSSHSH
ncbi:MULTISPECIES: hypothetical protein [Tepidibacillus]|uniref:PQ-loop repeat-containing protein n=1 Tax=Tepidibacillus decaturensis TaxID=1413211 RepID=A0A135L6U6_9BACI|nr:MULTISPECIES: hypothetical protein [Tepidibacillus]KXG44702.1 hypothetical protein U473_12210 [Tepidibacillus decaturensis]GBF12504.1 hypothetical protein HK1_02570 [Tepidibacillus sp. HK-1]